MCRLRILFVLLPYMPAVSLSADGTSWPCFHGPRRDNIATETGLMQSWPQAGPELLWTASGIGHGYSSVSIAAGRIYTAGMIDRQTYVTATDLTGKQLWQRLNGQSWQASEEQPWAVSYAGSRGTPTVEGDTVYHLSEMGWLTAFDASTGQQRWHVDVLKVFNAERPEYGYSESVLIQGDVLFCCPAGDKGYIVALDKRTGRTLWANTEIEDAVGNCSAVFTSIDGVEQVITVSAKRVLSFDPDNGRLLWDYAFSNKRENNVADVIISDGLVYATSGYGGGSILLRPQSKGGGEWPVDSVWKSDLLDNHHGGVLLFGGRLYGAGHEARGWFCLDFKTGRQLWQAPGKGSLTYADDMLYCLDEKGTINLVKATADEWQEAGSFRLPRGDKGLYWAHPVVCGRRLYVRHSDRLFAYDIGKD
ncbi:MAG: PQQ-like beta-propeller repeat protein [Phycisphaerales bacterium]|nr:MAG: PQQ-like beta-propeller repeat protein [Phycisphaerales bacterium]